MLTLDQIVPWGRSFEEYRRMFALSDADLRLEILGCADGLASFSAEASRLGHSVIQLVSLDPRGEVLRYHEYKRAEPHLHIDAADQPTL